MSRLKKIRNVFTESELANERIASLEADKAKLIAALEKIASGEGVYGKQAFEYKEIARAVLAEVQRD